MTLNASRMYWAVICDNLLSQENRGELWSLHYNIMVTDTEIRYWYLDIETNLDIQSPLESKTPGVLSGSVTNVLCIQNTEV